MIKQLKQPGLEGKKSWEEGRHTELLGILHHFPSRYLLIQKKHNAQAGQELARQASGSQKFRGKKHSGFERSRYLRKDNLCTTFFLKIFAYI